MSAAAFLRPEITPWLLPSTMGDRVAKLVAPPVASSPASAEGLCPWR